jgi:CheY-like chemotaxis protein
MYSILIAEDNFDFVDLLKERIRGFDESILISEAANGYEALDKIREKKYDLLITDFNMPVMNGMELVKSLKSIEEKNRPSNVIMLSAFLEPGEPSPDLSFVRFLPKDNFKDDLLNLLQGSKKKSHTQEKPQRRSIDRVQLKDKAEQVKVDIVGKNFVDIINAKDISMGGVAVYIPHFIIDCKIGEVVDCIITLPGEKIVITQGRIKHMGEDQNFFFGIEFVQMDQESKKNLTQFFEAHP